MENILRVKNNKGFCFFYYYFFLERERWVSTMHISLALISTRGISIKPHNARKNVIVLVNGTLQSILLSFRNIPSSLFFLKKKVTLAHTSLAIVTSKMTGTFFLKKINKKNKN
ncbi:hypothetical protein, unlikely [Trypanosoma brucei gambiense DAL972]|uniref:Uncharacterized protein n=1 Tax=Trypanosoma brucei gambiense (strain MHOM/CI/86/DAL972) TaxID=679716 RepID=C9ZP63_TRYB9|nr:hypothetical protein, unlikely [Trypanosoma brucei gambiense DAL972]CBH11191.1 hypothetical protein, unlikely [Trypanosoma brucei gambiense DAL972]|eukprot:XP_011773478.1 hypothetical protein, unlikely [Trypanosoma brucei gambiense DAL972]